MVALLLMVSVILFWVTETVVSGLGTVFIGNETTYSRLLLNITEGFTENAAIRYLRDPSYTGEDLLEDGYSCTIQVNSITDGKDLVSTCQKDNRSKAVGMTVILSNGQYQFSKMTER